MANLNRTRTLIGTPMRDGLSGLHGKLKNAAGRPQRIYTPRIICDALHVLWPEGIALDPCSGPESIVEADVAISPFRKDLEQNPSLTLGDGLLVDWVLRTYFNPPYKTLKDWLAKAYRTTAQPSCELCGLLPVRPHRKWWRKAVLAEPLHARSVCWLDSVTFVGYDQCYPTPLVMVYWGDRHDAFEQAFEGLGLTEQR